MRITVIVGLYPYACGDIELGGSDILRLARGVLP